MFKRYRQHFSPAVKYWVFLIGIIGVIFLVIFGSFIASYLSLELSDRLIVAEIFAKLAAFPFFGAMLLVVIIGTLVRWLFIDYIIPILRMAEQTRLITVANPEYRIQVTGAGLSDGWIATGGSTMGVVATDSAVYWSNATTTSIGRANLDGTGANTAWLDLGSTASSMTANGTYLYIGRGTANRIARAAAGAVPRRSSAPPAGGRPGSRAAAACRSWAGPGPAGSGRPARSARSRGSLPRRSAAGRRTG